MRIEWLAEVITDGDPVDWVEAEDGCTTEADRAVVRNLRIVSEISDYSRGDESSGLAEAPTLGDPAPRAGATRPAPRPLEPGTMWGPLRIEARVGSGGFGQVYRAHDTRLDRAVALKILHPDEVLDEARALADGRLMARVRHPNVVTVYGAERRDDGVGIWMEFIDGRTLEEIQKHLGPLGARDAAGIAIDLCGALAAVHREGLIHGDVKAQNVMKEKGGRLLLMDFGAARDLRSAPAAEIVSGTPLYLAPECFEGRPPTQRSDIYSLGVLVYHLVTGSFPVRADSLAELHGAHARGETHLLRDVRPDLPRPFIEVVEKALSRDPADRYESVGRMQHALSRALDLEDARETAPPAEAPAAPAPSASPRRRIALAAGILVAVAAAVATGRVAWGPGPDPIGPAVAGRGGEPPPSVPEPGSGGPDAELPAVPGAATDRGLPADRTGPGPIPPETTRLTDPPLIAAPPASPRADSPVSAPLPAGATDPESASFTIRAGLYRSVGTENEILVPGARIALGDQLHMKLDTSTSLHVYVLNHDDEGRTFVLFPRPDGELVNPLPAGTHRLPGPRRGDAVQLDWQVDSAGGREQILIVASRSRLDAVEEAIAALPPGRFHAEVGREEAIRLRGIGGVAPRPDLGGQAPPRRIFDTVKRLAHAEEQARGTWLRQIDLENPRRD